MLVVFVCSLALPLSDFGSGDISNSELECGYFEIPCRHQILRQDDQTDTILPSPSPNDWWFQFVDFYSESDTKILDILEPSPTPNYYYPATMPPPPPTNDYTLCMEKISKPFSFWNGLGLGCKEYLNNIGNSWHENSMRLELENAERLCFEAPQELHIHDKIAQSMLLDLKTAMSQSPTCTQQPEFAV